MSDSAQKKVNDEKLTMMNFVREKLLVKKSDDVGFSQKKVISKKV